MSIIGNRLLADELHKRGLLPPNCRLIEISVRPDGALVLRYETFVEAKQLALVAEALKATADQKIEDDERNAKSSCACGHSGGD